jgi:hypothetical protein
VLLSSLLMLSCTEQNFYTQNNTDVFQQQPRNTVDVLLVVDNSCSMIEEQVKLATNFDAFIQYFNGVDVDYQIAVITTDTVQEEFRGRFVGGDDEILLQGPTGALVDRVKYDREWTIPTGASLSLDANDTSSTYNDVRDNWCAGAAVFGDGEDLGTPGEANPTCDGSEAPPIVVGEDTEVRTPQAGDMVITEFMADPDDLEDNEGEWVELLNVSDHPVDLSGSALADNGRNSWEIPEGTIVQSGEFVVFGRDAMGDDFTLNNSVRVITPETDSADEIFAEMVAQGISGSGIEMGLEAARMAFEPENEEHNAGFLREDANLSFIFVSDEDDNSPDPVNDYLRFYTELKGEDAYRDHSQFNISSVVGRDKPEFDWEPSCSSSDGVADYGVRYVDLADRTNGLVESICDEDFSPIAQELGLVLSGLAAEFELSGFPDETTITAKLYSTNDEGGFERDLVKDTDFIYIRERNVIRFEEDQVPPAEWYVVVSYRLLAEGAVQTGAEDTGDTGQ